jgi:hypothetical protein
MDKDIICQRCGSINDYRTVVSGPHIKAICNGCDRYIKFIPKNEIDYCPKCGEVGSLSTEEYGCFHTITRCSNCEYSDITNINKALSDVEPMENKIMAQQPTWGAPAAPAPAPAQQQKTLAPIRLFPAHPNAPDFVLASGVIGLDEFFGFVQANPHLLSDYQGKAQLKFQILRSKEGKLYTQVDEYRPAPQPAAPQQWGGHAASPVAAPAQNSWGAAPAPAPAQNNWGAPQQPTGAQPYQDQLPF